MPGTSVIAEVKDMCRDLKSPLSIIEKTLDEIRGMHNVHLEPKHDQAKAEANAGAGGSAPLSKKRKR